MTRQTGVRSGIAIGLVLLAFIIWRGSAPAPERPLSDPGDSYRDEAAALLKANRLQEAAALIEKWKRAVPDDGRAVLAGAELAALGEQPDLAIELYSTAAATSADPARVWLRIAELQTSIGRSQQAVESCRRAVAARPEASDAHLRLGDLLRIAGRLDEAAEVLEPLLEESPSSVPVRHALAAVRNGQGRFEDVVELIGPFIGDVSLAPNAREHYAIALDELGRRAEAAAIWTGLLEADPYLVEGYYRLGRLARRLKRARLSRALLGRHEELMGYRDTLESARKSALSGHRVAASIERARAFASTHQIHLAVEHFQRAVRPPMADTDAALTVILSLVGFDLLFEAREIIHALRSTPALPVAIAEAMIGRVAERAGDTGAATAAYEHALAARPDYRSVLLALAGIRLEDGPETGDLAAASALIRRAHQMRADAESELLSGRVAFASGDLDAAGERLAEAVRLAERERRRAEARLFLAKIRLVRQDTEGARRLLEEVVAEAPTMADAWEALAGTLRARGDGERATEAAGKAAELKKLDEELREIRRSLLQGGGERAPLYLRLAELASRSGSRARQIRYLETALHVDARSAEAYRRLAAVYTEPGEEFLRIHALVRLTELEPQNAEARRRLEEARAAVRISEE